MLCCAVLALSQASSAEESVVVRMAGDSCFPPYEFVSESRTYVGFNVDLMSAIALQLGIDIEVMPMSWSSVRAALDRGAIDAIQGMKYSPDRDRIYDFSTPYLTSSMGIFVRSDRVDISDLDDLAGLTVAVQSGDISNESLSKIGTAARIPFENQQAALDALLAGKVDAFVGNRLVGMYLLQRKGRTAEVKIAGDPVDPAPYCIAVTEGDSQLLELLNRGIAEVQQSGLYDRIYAKWFGERVEPPSAALKRLIWALAAVTATVAVAAFIVFQWNRMLRKQVALRTRELSAANLLQTRILENSFNAVVAADSNLKIVAANARAAQMLSVDLAELIGRKWFDSPIGKLVSEGLVRETVQKGVVHRNQEARWRIDGEERVISFNLGPLRQTANNDDPQHAMKPAPSEGSTAPAQGKPEAGAVLVFSDITDSKRLGESEATRDKMDALATVIAGIAHEIRNPLTSIKAFVDLLPSKYDHPEFREEISKHLPAEMERLNWILTDLLDYARPRRPEKQVIDVGELIDSVVGMIGLEASARRIVLNAHSEPKLAAFADRNQIKQVLINIVLNALEALDGPAEIDIVSSRSASNMVLITVCDPGPGIVKDDLKRILEPFFTRKPKGTGMGLSVSYKLMRENGGDLSIDSTVGVGAKVTLSLPAAPPREELYPDVAED